MNNLASTYRWDEAEELKVQVVDATKRVLGAGASRHVNQHEQPSVDVQQQRSMGGGGRKATVASAGDTQDDARAGASTHADQHGQPILNMESDGTADESSSVNG